MVQSICPKCNQVGTQSIQSDAKGSSRRYLVFLHKIPTGYKRCYIGRVRTTEEAMGELNKPETVEEYEKTLKTVASEVRGLIKHYSTAKSGSVLAIVNSLRDILEKYGY